MLGVLLYQQGKLHEALDCIGRALEISPTDAEAHNNQGVVLKDADRLEEALLAFDTALALKPDYVDALSNRGTVLYRLAQISGALADYEKALALAPAQADILSNMGLALQSKHEYDRALACYAEAIRLAPHFADAHWNLALCHLLLGNYEKGWEEYEWRWARPKFTSDRRNFMVPQWDGVAPLAGRRILVYAEQGLGDALQFLRYVPLLIARGAQVVVELPAPLYPAFCNAFEAVVVKKGEVLPEVDFHCPLLSLPRAFHTVLESIPPNAIVPGVDEAKSRHWQERLAACKGVRVGIVWSGNPEQQENHLRSIPLSLMVALAPANVNLISLQKELRSQAERDIVAKGSVLHFGDDLHDFSDTLALMDNVDIVLTICTSVAHLAGVRGHPMYVLLHYAHDWRWLTARSDSPWYPTAKVFRQERPGEWAPVLECAFATLFQEISIRPRREFRRA